MRIICASPALNTVSSKPKLTCALETDNYLLLHRYRKVRRSPTAKSMRGCDSHDNWGQKPTLQNYAQELNIAHREIRFVVSFFAFSICAQMVAPGCLRCPAAQRKQMYLIWPAPLQQCLLQSCTFLNVFCQNYFLKKEQPTSPARAT
jgi:hypothetical protein